MIPGVNFVPVSEDLSDLFSQI